jgi:hypothetical protein
MLTEEKMKEIRQLLSKGVPEGELKNQLVSQGYTDQDIKKIFAPHKYDMRSWLLFFSIVIFFAALYFLITGTGHPLVLLLLAVFLFYEYYMLNKKYKKDALKKKD